MKRTLAALVCLSAVAAAQDLEQRIRDLEIREKALPTEAAEGVGLNVSFKDGLELGTTDRAVRLRIGGHVIYHGIFHEEPERVSPDTMTIREARLEVSAVLFENWEIFVAPNLLSSGSALHDGWVEFNGWEAVRVRAGQFKVPYSLESREPEVWQDYPENSLAFSHTPGRDIGAMVHGRLFGGIIDYAGGVFNGNNASSDENSDKDVAGYLGISPFAASRIDSLKHLRLGFSSTFGRQDGAADELAFDSRSPGTETEFVSARGKDPAAPVVRRRGDRRRSSADLAIGLGPVDFKTEVSYLGEEQEIDDEEDHFSSLASNWSIGWWFGGGRQPLKRPEVDRPLFGGGFGAVQVLVRYSQIDFDDEVIDREIYSGSNHVREYAAAVNWYPTRNVRISVMYTRADYGSERVGVGDPLPPKGGGRAGAGGGGYGPPTFEKTIDDEETWIVRLQVEF